MPAPSPTESGGCRPDFPLPVSSGENFPPGPMPPSAAPSPSAVPPQILPVRPPAPQPADARWFPPRSGRFPPPAHNRTVFPSLPDHRRPPWRSQGTPPSFQPTLPAPEAVSSQILPAPAGVFPAVPVVPPHTPAPLPGRSIRFPYSPPQPSRTAFRHGRRLPGAVPGSWCRKVRIQRGTAPFPDRRFQNTGSPHKCPPDGHFSGCCRNWRGKDNPPASRQWCPSAFRKASLSRSAHPPPRFQPRCRPATHR